MPATDPDEIFEIVNELGAVIGRARRAECHRDPRLLHRVAHVLVFTPAGGLLLQRRSPLKDLEPNKWDSSVGGHLAPGETPAAAARRELAEELGVAGVVPRFLYSYLWRDPREAEMVYSFALVHGGPWRPAPDEISELRAWPSAAIVAALGTGVFTPSFEHEWRQWLWPRLQGWPGGLPPPAEGTDDER